jgi:hypothetical protein
MLHVTVGHAFNRCAVFVLFEQLICAQHSELKAAVAVPKPPSRKLKSFETLSDLLSGGSWTRLFAAILTALLSDTYLAGSTAAPGLPLKPPAARTRSNRESKSKSKTADTPSAASPAAPPASIKTQLRKQIGSKVEDGTNPKARDAKDPHVQLFRTVSQRLEKLPGLIGDNKFALASDELTAAVVALNQAVGLELS